MTFELNAAFSLSISIGVIIGWARFFKTDPAFLPFLIYLTAGLVNEVLSISLMVSGHRNIINFNTFELAEALLLTWQFQRWGLFENKRLLYIFLQALFCFIWFTENFFAPGDTFNSYFIILHSFVIVMMSISIINLTALKDSTHLFKQPIFLLCLGLIAFFTYSILVEAFWIVGLNHRRLFRLRIFEIMSYINLFTNLIFAFAFLWIPMRPQYILRS